MEVNTSTVAFTCLATFSFIAISYAEYAYAKGWPAGEMFREDTSMIKIAGIMVIPGSLIAAIYLGS